MTLSPLELGPLQHLNYDFRAFKRLYSPHFTIFVNKDNINNSHVAEKIFRYVSTICLNFKCQKSRPNKI